ncbi:cytochrome c oxidase subunit 4 isoform 1, mitochondrial [Drosophila albomicans]|uniref:Cytochrome c oxidase subunit 4 n=1 Tax=Drosophila albomicans TaxID=7291 RepID=A0A6P8WYQ6_DROAB|nr:cytochrome c oxidase subunit 4 isoform 1, mitochondrial [Drosophila albomicans]XP_051863284.1 cytochrome c oxidase subunit 4 isoform 1, mitochondrial [Drosophila albomicans]
MLRSLGVRLPGAAGTALKLATAQTKASSSSAMMMMMIRRGAHNSQYDATRLMGGEREVVGYGINGSPIYIDCADFPFPAIRYGEVSPESCALREKEQGDWKKLSIEEKRSLYRHSFCQTYAEFQHFTPEWKLVIGVALWAVAIGILGSIIYSIRLDRLTPETFDEDRRQAQLRRMIHLQVQPITGLSSKWNYETNKWK